MFSDTWNVFSGRLPAKVFKTLNDRQSYFLSKSDKSKKSSQSKLSYVDKKSQAILKRVIDLKFGFWCTLGWEDETVFWDT